MASRMKSTKDPTPTSDEDQQERGPPEGEIDRSSIDRLADFAKRILRVPVEDVRTKEQARSRRG